MKKLNKLFAILVAMAMVLSLTVISAFAEDDPEPNKVDFAVTKLLKVPAGTEVPANTSVKVVVQQTKYNSVAVEDIDGYSPMSKTVPLNLVPTSDTIKNTDKATTYYYYTTGNLLAELGFDDTTPVGVYQFTVGENEYTVNGKAYNDASLAENGQYAKIENGGTYNLTVAKSSEGYEITASQGNSKVIVKDYKSTDNTSVTENGLKLVNSYYEKGSGDSYDTSKVKATKTVTDPKDFVAADEKFDIEVKVTLPEVEGASFEGWIKHSSGQEEQVTGMTSGVAKAIKLAEGDYFFVKNAPKGTLVDVIETDERAGDSDHLDGKMFLKTGEQTNVSMPGASENATLVTINNAYQDTTQEGVLMANLPYIVLALVAIGGMVAYVVVRRRNADEA